MLHKLKEVDYQSLTMRKRKVKEDFMCVSVLLQEEIDLMKCNNIDYRPLMAVNKHIQFKK
jgi:hypothetical protein